MSFLASRLRASQRPALRAMPSCRGGASSLLRLIPRPAAGSYQTRRTAHGWMGALGLAATPVQPSTRGADAADHGFAPSRWLIGH